MFSCWYASATRRCTLASTRILDALAQRNGLPPLPASTFSRAFFALSGAPRVAPRAAVATSRRRWLASKAATDEQLAAVGVGVHGSGALAELLARGDALDALRAEAVSLPTIRLNARHLCDIELLLNGAFSPLRGFMSRAEYESVVDTMRLPDGTIFPLPITLDVGADTAKRLECGARVVLQDAEGDQLAVMTVSDVWQPSLETEAKAVFGTTETLHAGAEYLLEQSAPYYVGGTLEGLQLPVHYDYVNLRQTPRELRAFFHEHKWNSVVGFQTRNPIHRAHRVLTVRAAENEGCKVLIHPVVGLTKPGDVDHHTRVKCYKAIMPTYPPGTARLSLLNLAMRMGGPREALLHAVVRKNYGCTHFIVGRDHAGPGDNAAGEPFYGPYDAQELCMEHQQELAIQFIPFQAMLYVPARDAYFPVDKVPVGEETLNISGTELRRRLRTGEEIPSWFSYADVVKILRRNFPSRADRGLTLFFTGLSGSGKSTIANALMYRLLSESSSARPVSLLDGDHVRTMLSSELGFSKEHRDLNIRRIAYVASLINKSRGLAICAPIAPYRVVRDEARRINEEHGGFVEIFVSTSLETCEQRDRKGLYKKARAGELKGFTGIDDPYEEPASADIELDTAQLSVSQSVDKIMAYLIEKGYIEAEEDVN